MKAVPNLLRWASLETELLPAAGDLEHAVQRRMFWFGATFVLAMLPIYAGMLLLIGGSFRNVLPLVLIFIPLGGIVWWTVRHQDFRRSLMLLHSVSFAGLLLSGLLTFGVNTPGFWWMTVIPFVTILSGLTLLGIVQAIVVIAYAIAAYFVQPALPVDPGAEAVRLHVAVVLSTLYAAAFLALATLWRQQLQRALERARIAADAAADAKARFVANMSHEIRTPLNGVIGSIELLRSLRTSEAQRAQIISLQEQSAKSLLALINDVLDWCKLESGKVELEAEPVYLRGLVFEANELFAAAAFDKGLELTSSCDDDVPRRFVADATRLRQIVNNLVSNAVKFTHHGGVHIHLSVLPDPTLGPPLQRVRIEVADSGVGVPPERIERLFRAFEQSDASVTRKYGGTGLGLSIAAELARLMHGGIEVISTPGHGSSFALVVPLAADGSADALPLPQRRDDIVLASASAGLVRHVSGLLRELGITCDVVAALPEPSALAGRRLLLVDAPLLDSRGRRWVDQVSAGGMRVVMLAPLNSDAALGPMPEGWVLYKPVRRTALAALLGDGAEVDAVADPGAPRIAGGRRVPTPHVLLCEDNPVNQLIVQAMLAELGATCRIAGNGVDALRCLESDVFDLVLMDVQMPELDGLSATRRWRSLEDARQAGRVPIVAMTANTESEDGAVCRAAGMDSFLGKPFGLAALRACLARHRAVTLA